MSTGSYEHVELDRRGPKTVITFDEPETRNSLSQGMIDDLCAALKAAERDDSAAVVLTGKEGTFCAGGDLSSVTRNRADALSGRMFGDSDFRRPFDLVERLQKPVIAAVNGTALGGGFELALVADIVVVGEAVEVGTPETQVGLIPGVAVVRLTEQIGHHRAMDLMMTGRRITGTEAIDLGLFNEAVPVDRIDDVVDDYVARFDSVAPLGITLTKKVAARHRGGEDVTASELALGILVESDDIDEGLDAFAEKRDPEFTGE